MVRGLTQRPGGQARPGEDWRGSSWCPPGEDAPGLHTGPHARPPGPRGGVASEVGPGGETDSWTGSLASQGHTPTRSHAPGTHTLPGHMGMAGAPDSPTPEGPRQQREATTRPQHSHTHIHTHTRAQTSHGLGPTVGAEDLSWESALRATPSLGFLAQYGGQESPILLQGWPRQENSSGGGWTDRRRGGQSRLCSAS